MNGRKSKTGRSGPGGTWIASLPLTPPGQPAGWLSPCGRLHIKKHLNEAVDKVRRQEHRKLEAAGAQDLSREATAQLRHLLQQDLQTGTAWALKENFGRFWKYTSLAWAMKFLWGWVEAARATGLTPLAKAADLVDKHAEGILNHLIHPVTNAAAEGLNSIIQSLKHAARGLPRFESFRTRILFFLGGLTLSPLKTAPR